jgi:ribosomal-protein-alanine acetyltransferase
MAPPRRSKRPAGAVRVRRLRPEDVGAVARIERAVFGSEAWPHGAFAYAGTIFDGAPPARGRLWVAVERGRIVGYAGLELSVLGGEADLINLAVTPAARRRRVGRRLAAAAIGFCRQRGVALLWLRVRASNRAARAFYRRVGFRPVGRFRGYYRTPREDAVLMALSPRPGPSPPGSDSPAPRTVQAPRPHRAGLAGSERRLRRRHPSFRGGESGGGADTPPTA